MKVHTVEGGRGVKLHVREWGNPEGPPVLFIHGWSQNHLCWVKQYESAALADFRLIAFDLRGHGMSDAPIDSEQYADGDAWADDVAAIMRALGLDETTLVAWSYGGYVVCDYVRKYGQAGIAGINFAGAAVALGKTGRGLIGPAFAAHAPGACRSDVPTNIAAIRNFLRACFAKPVSPDEFETILAFNMLVSSKVRLFLSKRELDFSNVLSCISKPVLVAHGRADNIVLPAMADYILAHCKGAAASWYDDIGHAPFLEDAERFNNELAAFVRKVHPLVR